ncbi:MAG: uracil-DNA glycosylase, partial [Burkholderiaceae bacterium]
MVDFDEPATLRLSPIQRAWLREIGIDKNLLKRFGPSDVDTMAAVPERVAIDRPVRTKALLGAVSPISGSLPHDLESLRSLVAICEACPLHAGRSQTVFGSGAVESVQWMIIGEAPGERDDRAGLPFQGTAGTLLHAMLAAVGVRSDSSVFFTNLVKCRPLGNRPPEPAEIAACLPYLRRQIALLNPRRILTLGRLASQGLLNDDSDFEHLRGRVHGLLSENGVNIPLVATYHPAFLLSRPQYKASAWHDLNLACAALG